MGTKSNPSQFDCYRNAEPNEPLFVLLARDPVAAAMVDRWADEREFLILLEKKPRSDEAMIAEARQCAAAMRAWRAANRPPMEEIPRRRREVEKWGSDDEGWDHETGAPGIILAGNAIQVWAMMQDRTAVSVAEAAAAFNVLPQRIVEAVEDHPWMYLTGPRDDYTKLLIKHDGE